MHVTHADGVAVLSDDASHFTSDSANFALWLNTAFLPAGRDASELANDLRNHGCTVDGQEPFPELGSHEIADLTITRTE